MLPIPGTGTVSHLEENLAAADMTLSGEELTTIGAAISEMEVVGSRYPEPLERMTGL